MKRRRWLSLEWCVQGQKGPVTPSANQWCLQQKKNSFGSSEPAGFLPCLCPVRLSCLVASSCFARVFAPGYSLEPSVEVLEGWAGPDSSSLLWLSVHLLRIAMQEFSCEVIWKGRGCLHVSHRRGEGEVRFRSFCWPFASQVLGFEENQNLEWDLEFCEMRVKAGFNMLAIASVAEEIHNNIYYWVGVSRVVLCLQIPHRCRWTKQRQKGSLLLMEKLLWKLNIGEQSHSHTIESVDWLLMSSERIEYWL